MTQTNTAIVTICRDDRFFLTRFVAYYGGLFGRDSIYIISHGDEPMVREVAAGCNIFPVPAIETDKFTMLHWRTKNALLTALRQWYTHVIVVDVDEFVVVDPASGMNLRTWLDRTGKGAVHTALGLEITHLRSIEQAPVTDGILGPRMHAQYAHFYCKPCIVSRPAKLARGGHYANHGKLSTPDFLYLFHMKYCDYDLFVDTNNRRNAFIEEQKKTAAGGKVRTNPQWFAENRKDAETFAAFEARAIDTEFDMAALRQAMHDTWAPRNNDLWHFRKRHLPQLFRLPDRFAGADRIDVAQAAAR